MRFSLATTIFPLAVFAAVIPKPVVKTNGIAMKLTERTSFPNPDNIIDVDVLNAHVASLTTINFSKVLRSFDNYEKNTGTTHPYAVHGSGIRERAAGAPLMSNQKIWYTELSIGTPPKTFSVEIDTGSSDTFVPWYHCDSSCAGHAVWNPDESSTAENLNKGFSFTFGDDAAVTGVLYADNVIISGYTADKQTIGAAMTYSTNLHKSDWAPDGMLGMAFESLATFAAKPLFTTLADSGVIQPVFSVKLTSNGGELYVGGANPELYKNEFTYTPVTQQGFWQVEIQNIQDGRGHVAVTNVPAIIDTGATYIIGDTTRVSNMYVALGGEHVDQGYYCFPCNSFPTISFSFNGKVLEIPPELLNIGKISPSSDKCWCSIFGKDTGASFWSIGGAFLRGYYTTFEFGENPRVGFAELR